MRPLSLLLLAGKGTAEIAASLGDGVAAARRVRQHFKARGTLEPQPPAAAARPS